MSVICCVCAVRAFGEVILMLQGAHAAIHNTVAQLVAGTKRISGAVHHRVDVWPSCPAAAAATVAPLQQTVVLLGCRPDCFCGLQECEWECTPFQALVLLRLEAALKGFQFTARWVECCWEWIYPQKVHPVSQWFCEQHKSGILHQTNEWLTVNR